MTQVWRGTASSHLHTTMSAWAPSTCCAGRRLFQHHSPFFSSKSSIANMLRLKIPFLKSSSQESSTTYAPSTTSDSHEPLPSPVVAVVVNAWEAHDWNHSSDALTQWLNARWAKSGYQVSSETVCFTLRSKGKDARMGLGDGADGAFCREKVDGAQ